MQQRIHNTSWRFDQSARCSYTRDNKKNLFGAVSDGGVALLPVRHCLSALLRSVRIARFARPFSVCTRSGVRGTAPKVAVRYDTTAGIFSHPFAFG